jgi:hypothetical protein
MLGFLLSLPSVGFATSRGVQSDDDIPNDDDQGWSSPQDNQEYTQRVFQAAITDHPGLLKQVAFLKQVAVDPSSTGNAELHAKNAKKAAKVAKQAAKVANKVAEHSIKVTGHAKKALKHALGALHDARVDSKNLDKGQKASLKKAEAHLREATKTAEYGELKKVKNTEDQQKQNLQKELDWSKGMSERTQMRKEIEELRKQLKDKRIDDPEINKALDELKADLDSSKGPVNDESKAELERLRQSIESLDAAEPPVPVVAAGNITTEDETSAKPSPDAQQDVTPIEEKGFDIDTQMPYGDLEPFGREDTAQELTEQSVKESDDMVDNSSERRLQKRKEPCSEL